MANILLINDGIKDNELIINACNENTHAITYNELTDTYDSLFEKYQNVVNDPSKNIQTINHVAIVAHGNPNLSYFTFLENEKNMILYKLIENNNEITNVCKEIEICDNEINNLLEYIYQDISFSDVSYDIKKMLIYPELTPNELQTDEMININNKLNDFKLKLSDNPSYLKIKDLKQKIIDLLHKRSSILKIENNLETWGDFKTFIKKFNIQKSLDFLGCALLESEDWKYCLNLLETEEHLNINIRSSDDDTGNLKVGGDWVLESDNINIKYLYFTKDIGKWLYTLNDTYFTGIRRAAGNVVNLQNQQITIHNINVTGRTGSIGQLTINKTGIYEIIARGACGGKTGSSREIRGGYGAIVSDKFQLSENDKLYFLIGKRGTSANTDYNSGWGSGGGGGTFVVTKHPIYHNTYTDDDIYIIAGGGGGSIYTYASTTGNLYGGDANNIRDASAGVPGEVGRHGGNPIVDMTGTYEGVEADLKYGNAYDIFYRNQSRAEGRTAHNNGKPNQPGKEDYVDSLVPRPYSAPRKMRNPFFRGLGGINGYGGGGGGCAGGAGFFGNGSIGSQLNYTSISTRWAMGFQYAGGAAGYACQSLNQNGVGGYGGGGHGANGGSGYGGGGGGYSGGAGGMWHHGRTAFWGPGKTVEQVWNAALASPNNMTSVAYTVDGYSTSKLWNSSGGAGSSFYNSTLSMGEGRFRPDLQSGVGDDDYGGELIIRFYESPYTVENSIIKFSDLYKNIIDDTWTININKSISLSEFRGIGPVPESGPISIKTDFKGKTFELGSEEKTLEELKNIFTDNVLHNMYLALSGAGGTMYDINNDAVYGMDYGKNNIVDGGSDMYDGGNKIDFNSNGTYLTYNENITIVGNPTAKYFIKIGKGDEGILQMFKRFFIFFADVGPTISNIRISGNNGADNQGEVRVGDYDLTKGNTEYKVFWKSVEDHQVRDPAINHIWIVKNEGALSRDYAPNTDNDKHILHIDPNYINRVYYIMWGGIESEGHTNNAQVTAVVNSFLSNL